MSQSRGGEQECRPTMYIRTCTCTTRLTFAIFMHTKYDHVEHSYSGHTCTCISKTLSVELSSVILCNHPLYEKGHLYSCMQLCGNFSTHIVETLW